METLKKFIGVDVGKSKLMVTEIVQEVSDKFIKLPTSEIPNAIQSISDWIECLPTDCHVIYEHTGNYSLNLAYCLELADLSFTALSPSQSKGFAQTMKVTNQNDTIDASLLAYYGVKYQPKKSTIESEEIHHLKQKRHHLSALMAQKLVVTNRLHALSFDNRADKKVIESLELLKTTFEIEIDQFKKELYTLDDNQYRHLFEIMSSVVGIGEASANAIIVATNGLKDFDNVKQVLKFFGIVPSQKDSGTSVRKKYGIAKTGVGYARSILYMAARSAKRFNLACMEVYKKQRNLGKCHKVAMIAVMNKLIRQVFAVVKNDTVFVNNYEFNK